MTPHRLVPPILEVLQTPQQALTHLQSQLPRQKAEPTLGVRHQVRVQLLLAPHLLALLTQAAPVKPLPRLLPLQPQLPRQQAEMPLRVCCRVRVQRSVSLHLQALLTQAAALKP